MRLVALAGVVVCVAAPAWAQQRPTRLLDAPVISIRPQSALSSFSGEPVGLVVGWRPVNDAAKYRVTLTQADGTATDLETTALRIEKKGLIPGRYQITVTAIDKTGTEGAISEAMPLTVIEVRATPPGTDRGMPPIRGAYAVGTRFASPGMHCEVSNAPIDDLLVGPENELRITTPGMSTLRCGGIPGYLEKQIVMAPVKIAAATPVERGKTTLVHVTLASVAYIGTKLQVQGSSGVTLGTVVRTDFGVDVSVTTKAKTATLAVRAGDFELGRAALELYDSPSATPPPPRGELDWKAADSGAHFGVFAPPSTGGGATTIGRPTAPADAITAGPFIGVHAGFFPTRRVGLEGEVSLAATGYAEGSGVSQLLATRAQLAVRALERGRAGVRFLLGTGAWTMLSERGSSQRTTDGEIHLGTAISVATTPHLWLRFQLADVVTTSRDGGFAHCLEIQLGIVTRVGRRDSF